MAALVDTLAEVVAIEPTYEYRTGRPSGPGWHPLAAALTDADTVQRWFELHRALWPGSRRDIGGSYFAWSLSRLLVRNLVIAVAVKERGWTLDPGDLTVRIVDRLDDPEAETTVGLALDSRLIALATDGAAAEPGTIVVADRTELIERCAEEITRALEPVFAAVRSVAPYGQAGMWGAVADDIAATAVLVSDHGIPFADARALTDALTAALRRRTRFLRTLPTFELVERPGGTVPVFVKGTCCLWYKSQDSPDPAGDGYCHTCPHRDRDVLIAEHLAHLDTHHATD